MFIAAASSELHPRSLETAVARDAIKLRLREATDRAGDLGVLGVPAVVVGDEVFWGDDRLEDGGRGGLAADASLGLGLSYVAAGG